MKDSFLFHSLCRSPTFRFLAHTPTIPKPLLKTKSVKSTPYEEKFTQIAFLEKQIFKQKLIFNDKILKKLLYKGHALCSHNKSPPIRENRNQAISKTSVLVKYN